MTAPDAPKKVQGSYRDPLQIVGYISTRRGDPERGPEVRIRGDEAQKRLVVHGELVWIIGAQSRALAPLIIDETIPRGGVVARDIPGIVLTDIVRILKVDLDRVPKPGTLA